ncbi:MAG: toxin [Gammaproteobacteria bacterium]|nr:toxin [Gammaproteobacteria bacterium]
MKVYNWNADKNQDLILGRNISFEEAIFYIKHGGLLDDIVHPNTEDYPNQRIFIVRIVNYVYLVPYVENEVLFKTIIPSRKFTKMYLEGKL